MKLTIDLEQSVIDRIKNKSDYDVTAILNAVDKALSEQENKDKRKSVKLKSKYTWNGKIDKVC